MSGQCAAVPKQARYPCGIVSIDFKRKIKLVFSGVVGLRPQTKICHRCLM